MTKLMEVKDEDIFIRSSPYTNLIKSKKLRLKLLEKNIKVEINKKSQPLFGLPAVKKLIVFTFHRPESMDKKEMNDIVSELSEVIYRKYEYTQVYEYLDLVS